MDGTTTHTTSRDATPLLKPSCVGHNCLVEDRDTTPSPRPLVPFGLGTGEPQTPTSCLLSKISSLNFRINFINCKCNSSPSDPTTSLDRGISPVPSGGPTPLQNRYRAPYSSSDLTPARKSLPSSSRPDLRFHVTVHHRNPPSRPAEPDVTTLPLRTPAQGPHTLWGSVTRVQE